MTGMQVGPYEDYVRLLKKYAGKGLRRLHAAGARSIEYGDVLSHMSETWLSASRGYDPSFGVPFIPYLSRAIWINFNRWANEQIGEEGSHISIDTQPTDTEEGEGGLHDLLADDRAEDPILQILRRESFARVMRRLSPDAQTFIRLLLNPPEELYKENEAIQARCAYGRDRGINAARPKHITFSLIGRLMGLNRVSRANIFKEIDAALAATSSAPVPLSQI